MKFPTVEEMAKDVAEKAMDEYIYEGKTIRQWVEVLKDYDDKKTIIERILERLKEERKKEGYHMGNSCCGCGYDAFTDAIEIVKEEGGL